MMKYVLSFFVLVLAACAHTSKVSDETKSVKLQPDQSGYLKVNGTDIYYEMHGTGEPLVLLHGGGSDIHVSFGKGIVALSKHFRVIAFDEQGHGKSPVSDRPFGFENTAKDIAEALKQLHIEKAKFIGFSNGATTGMYIGILYPDLMSKMVLGSGLYSRKGAPPQFWEMMKGATINSMPQELKDAYVKVSPRPQDLQKMFEYDSNRMRTFKDIPEKSIRAVKVPVLIMQTDQDVATLEHGVYVTRLLPQGRFAVLPGPHDNFIGSVSKDSPAMAQASLNIMIDFLK
ncbi:alpha/beta hydrolase [Bdellovibrio sp. SKB1291214]|uniref:alpha/beta fold hydrolase n=1 Tax=Bdellovibrio sp. SKB1291214 TaxID=1732569 RepID=UPI000B5153EE|nr:alpha/beta hydrolase [Bdellovibrio sp. SKB1291214]UYL07232.1 alpha/beta hydrolase [Bdellovibrio sp. SKB1291214]